MVKTRVGCHWLAPRGGGLLVYLEVLLNLGGSPVFFSPSLPSPLSFVRFVGAAARKWTSPMLRSVLAGGAAGLTLRMGYPSMRHTIASYVAVRAIRTLASHKVAIGTARFDDDC